MAKKDETQKATLETEEPRAKDGPAETVDPVTEIALHMRTIANGGSVEELREAVTRLMPREQIGARQLFNKLMRLRDSGEVVVRVATEILAQVENG